MNRKADEASLRPQSAHTGSKVQMKFGDRVRQLRRCKGLGQRALAQMVGILFSYVSKIENKKLDFGDDPSEELILRIAAALEADQDELLIMARPAIRRAGIVARPSLVRAHG